MHLFHKKYTVNCGGQIMSLEQPKVMGILNLTPDSFYDGGRYHEESSYLKQVEKMIHEGAHIIDVGGMSSRPGAKVISAEEEMSRIIKPIRKICRTFSDVVISVDTVHSSVARAAVDAGALMVNDISAGSIDEDMFKVAAELNVPYVLMHMRGLPQDMQENTVYEELMIELLDFFISKIAECRSAGIKDIIIDPGLGFGKSIKDNFRILRSLRDLDMLELPVLLGASRKSMIYKTLDINIENSVNGTTAVNMVALMNGCSILRVHDVKEAVECIRIFNAYMR